MTDLELIQDVLCNYPQHYLMFRAGSGGEFLSDLIAEYSDKFRKFDPKRKQVIKHTNRTLLQLPFFYQSVSAVRTRSTNFDNFLMDIYNIHKFNNVDIQTSVDNAISFLKEHASPPLFRIHISFNPYFTKHNSHMLLVDTEHWYDYKEILLFLKAHTLIECNSDVELTNVFNYELGSSINNAVTHNLLNNALDWTIKNNIKKLSSIQIETVKLMALDPTITFDDIFYNSPLDVFKKYNHINNTFLDYYNFVEPKMKNQVNIIKYSKVFNKGYLEDMFDIESADFHTRLIQWHDDNLKLMLENKFDISQYVC
jgi:hypothetical protein